MTATATVHKSNLGVSVKVRAAYICLDVGLVALWMESTAGRFLQSLYDMLPPARRKACTASYKWFEN